MAAQDQVIISFGHLQYILPSKAGMAIFAALSGAEVYIRQERYEQVDGKYGEVSYISPAGFNELPRLQHISPVQFHIGLENQRVKNEAEAAKAKDAREA